MPNIFEFFPISSVNLCNVKTVCDFCANVIHGFVTAVFSAKLAVFCLKS